MNRFVSLLCYIFLKPIVKILFIKEVKGWENIPKRNFILAPNHSSHLDQLVTGYVCVPRKFHYIGQIDRNQGTDRILLQILYTVAGVIRVHRKNEESKKEAVEKSIEVLKKGASLIIYPEGTRTRNGKWVKGNRE